MPRLPRRKSISKEFTIELPTSSSAQPETTLIDDTSFLLSLFQSTSPDEEPRLVIAEDVSHDEQGEDSSSTELAPSTSGELLEIGRIPSPTGNEGCGLCLDPVNQEMIWCDGCDTSFHYKCAKLSNSQVSRILKYYCVNCECDESLATEWYGEKPTGLDIVDKELNYFTVERILDMRTRNGVRQFLVKWLNYDESENSWVDEKDMNGCVDMLQKFLRKRNKKLSDISYLLGAKKSDKTNEDNWVSPKQVIEAILKFKTWNPVLKKISIDIAEFDQFKEHDGLYLLGYKHHAYMLLYLHDKRIAYIADGGNLFRRDQKLAHDIRDLLEIRLISVSYDRKVLLDHCGSAAAIIGLELLRCYGKQQRPVALIPTKSWGDKISKSFHRHSSAKIKFDKNLNLVHYYECSQINCQRKFNTKKQCALHEWSCKAK